MKNIDRKLHPIFLLIIFISLFPFSQGYATEAYSDSTGKECKVCHVDPMGGGDLTETGRGFLLSITPYGSRDIAERDPVMRSIKLVTLYLHIVTAFLWFGTILYVHLVLKPAYASQGLPGGEVRVGLFSMVVMAVTGFILTYYKLPSLALLFTSRFGFLLLVKIILFFIMVVSALYVVFVIGPKLKKKQAAQPAQGGAFSAEQLAHFDGREGRPAYFAFKDKVYDATHSELWKDGNHMMRHQAGVDLTEVLEQAPHDEDKIISLPEVGNISTGKADRQQDSPKKIFFFMAYMNLGFVFLVCLILALWRW